MRHVEIEIFMFYHSETWSSGIFFFFCLYFPFLSPLFFPLSVVFFFFLIQFEFDGA